MCAAFSSAALVVLFAVGWLFVARAQAQAPTRIEGQLLNGTRDAPATSVANVPVTLFQITQAGPMTRTIQTDAQGKFLFTDVITDANSYFTRVDYAGIRYFSEIRPPELAAALPLTMTVYETQPLPADFTLDRAHLILDVQAKKFNGLQLLQVTNPTDRAFYLPLPIPANASEAQFEDFREQTRVLRQADGTILYPILPTTTDLVYGLVLPFTPPEYRLQIPFQTNVNGVNLLVSRTGEVAVNGENLVRGEPFKAQSGQEYWVLAGPAQRAGTSFAATISNLPGVDNTQTMQSIVLVVGGLGALALLAYPVYQRRTRTSRTGAASERVARLQALAQLDDAFEQGVVDEDEYYARRAGLKAELLKREA